MAERPSGAGRIPVDRIITRLDALFDRRDYEEAERLLTYWRDEAVSLGDRRGEYTVESELVGFYRKQNDRENALRSVKRALFLTDELRQGENASGATVLINCATAYKAFGMSEEAMPLYRRAEHVYRSVLSPTDRRFGGLYNNMALALVDLGEVKAAESAYFSALEVMGKQTDGELECAITYVNLAHMYEKFGMTEKISDCMKRAYSLLRSDTLDKNGYYAFVVEKCAPSFAHFGDKALYEELKKESDRIYEGA